MNKYILLTIKRREYTKADHKIVFVTVKKWKDEKKQLPKTLL